MTYQPVFNSIINYFTILWTFINLWVMNLWNLSPFKILCYRRRDREDTSRDRDRIKNALNLTGSEKSQLEKVRSELNNEIDNLQRENEKLQAANTDLQRQRDRMEDERDDVFKDKERQVKENDRWWIIYLIWA